MGPKEPNSQEQTEGRNRAEKHTKRKKKERRRERDRVLCEIAFVLPLSLFVLNRLHTSDPVLQFIGIFPYSFCRYTQTPRYVAEPVLSLLRLKRDAAA